MGQQDRRLSSARALIPGCDSKWLSGQTPYQLRRTSGVPWLDTQKNRCRVQASWILEPALRRHHLGGLGSESVDQNIEKRILVLIAEAIPLGRHIETGI